MRLEGPARVVLDEGTRRRTGGRRLRDGADGRIVHEGLRRGGEGLRSERSESRSLLLLKEARTESMSIRVDNVKYVGYSKVFV